MTILLDDRAGSKDLLAPLESLGARVCLSQLNTADGQPYGDVAFVGNGPSGNVFVVVEVKTVSDMLSSSSNGRLQDVQLRPLLSTADVPWLLVFGAYQIDPSTGYILLHKKDRRGRDCWRRQPFQGDYARIGTLAGLLFTFSQMSMDPRVPPLRVHLENAPDFESATFQAAVWINLLYRWWSKKWTDHKSLKIFHLNRQATSSKIDPEDECILPDISDDQDCIARFAMAFPGMGYKRAMLAGAHFSSPDRMLTATEEEWQSIRGIGKKLAKNNVQVAKTCKSSLKRRRNT